MFESCSGAAFATTLRPLFQHLEDLDASWASIAAAARVTAPAQADVAVFPSPALSSTSQADVPGSKSDRPNRITTISCGQALALLAIYLLVVIYLELPPDVQARLADDITVITFAALLAQRVIKNS